MTAESITAQARAVRFGPWLLNLIAFLLISFGRGLYATLHGLWFGCVWSVFAVREGWRQGKAAQAHKKMQAEMRARNR